MSSNATIITRLELENIKRIKEVQITPTPEGLTIIAEKTTRGKHPCPSRREVIAKLRVERNKYGSI